MIPTVSVGKNEAVSRRNFACFVFGFIFPLPRATTRVTLSSSSVLSTYLHFLNSIGSVAERSLASARNCVTGFCFQAGMEADDFSKLAAAATTVNEGGAVAASSVSTTADELSMLKAVMLSHAQITQGLLLAQAQATQELLETLKPSLYNLPPLPLSHTLNTLLCSAVVVLLCPHSTHRRTLSLPLPFPMPYALYTLLCIDAVVLLCVHRHAHTTPAHAHAYYLPPSLAGGAQVVGAAGR